MGVFEDKKFDELNWMTQMTETIESPLNVVLAKLPEEQALSYNEAFEIMEVGYGRPSISAETILRTLLKQNSIKLRSWRETDKLCACFNIVASDDLVIDIENEKMLGTIKLIKVKNAFSDEELQADMGSTGVEALDSIDWTAKGAFSRANEVMELLGHMEDHIKHKSARKKHKALVSRLKTIFKTNEWRIRDTELADKVGTWISQYIRCGDLGAFSNFCKLKVMTHGGLPIYSIQESE